MTGHVIGIGPCWSCGRIFSFDVELVPSIEGAPPCRPCVEAANVLRAEAGEPLIVIYPGSYPGDE